MKRIIIFASFLLASAIIFTSCKKETPVTSSEATPPIFTPPSRNCAGEYNLDIILDTTYAFVKKYNNPWDYNVLNSYYDLTEIIGKCIIPPLDEFNIYVYEYADTAAQNDTVYDSRFQISKGNIDPLFVDGICSINFKGLIRQGGGSFTGTFIANSGSAKKCNATVFTNLPPLIVTGNLNVGSHTINLRIKGKVFF